MKNLQENTDLFVEFLFFLENLPNIIEEEGDHIQLFHKFLIEQCLFFYRKYQLEPLLYGSSDGDFDYNIKTVYECFIHDVNRMKKDSLPNESGNPDHFKLAGTLAYWLRRNPIAYAFEVKPSSSDMDNEFPPKRVIDIFTREKYELKDMEEIKEKYFPWYLMFRYHQAYFAFHTGLDICNYFECKRSKEFKLKAPKDFLHMACHFIEYKNISPHGLAILYQALHQTPNTASKIA